MSPATIEPSKLCVGVILAGGEGHRMGQACKPLLSLGGRPLLCWTIERLRPQVADLALAVAEAGDRRFARFGLPLLADPAPGRQGPLAAIAGALQHYGQIDPLIRRVLFVPGDQPFPPVDLGRRLAHAMDLAGSPAAYATAGDRSHYACTLWDADALPAVERALREGQRSLGGALAAIGATAVPVRDDCGNGFLNVNRPSNMAAARAVASTSNTGIGGESS